MSTHSLTVSYAGASSLADVYWVRIEQDVVDETATVSDAASLLDALYDLDPCEGASTEEPATDETATTGEPTTDLATAVEETLDLSFCDADYDGSVEVDIRIYRSHLAEPYTLRLQGGELISTVQAEGQVTVTGEISSEMTLQYPVVSGFSCTPAPVKRTGNTLRFAEAQVGRSMTATYQSRWDVATVKVLGVDGEVGECRALAFHHGVVADVDLEMPDADEMDKSLCPSVGWKPLSEREEVTCYRDVVVIQKCQCSEEELNRYTYQQTVPCPDREIKCPGVLTECLHNLGTESVVERVACDSDNQIGGGSLYTYKVSDADYYRKTCCQEPPGPLPPCPAKRTTYTGNLPIQYGEAYWRDIYGDNARFVPVPPPGGICGEWIIKQQVSSGNCCDGVPELVWDTSISPEVMAPNSAAMIAVTGGRGPYTWVVDGHGFQFQNGARSIVTAVPTVRLSALTIACGTATIACTDGCSSATAEIRCTAGRWVVIYLPTSPLAVQCVVTGGAADYIGNSSGFPIYEVVSGRWKLVEVEYAVALDFNCGGHDNPQCQLVSFDPRNPLHHSCIDDFAGPYVPELGGYGNQACYWENTSVPGYLCTRTWSVEHRKTLWEWRC